VGTLELRVPQARQVRFQTKLFGRYQRQEAALMTTIAEMYYQGVSTRRVATIMEQLGGFEVSSTTVSRVAAELDEQLEQIRSRRLDEKPFPYLMIDARYEKVRVEGHVTSQALLVTAGINGEGVREILDWRVANSESEWTWEDVFQTLKARGLHGVEMIVSDAHAGIRAAIERQFQGIRWQRCQVHFIRELLKKVSWKQFAAVARDLKTIFRTGDPAPSNRAASCSEMGKTIFAAESSTSGRNRRLPGCGNSRLGAPRASGVDELTGTCHEGVEKKNSRHRYFSQPPKLPSALRSIALGNP
jgi:transposase-like protein